MRLRANPGGARLSALVCLFLAHVDRIAFTYSGDMHLVCRRCGRVD